LRRLRIALAVGRFSADECSFGLKATAKPSQGFNRVTVKKMNADREHALEVLIRARYPIIYIVSWEERRVEESLRQVAAQRRKKLYGWTVTKGVVSLDSLKPVSVDPTAKDPVQALEYVASSRDSAIFVLKDFHPFLDNMRSARNDVVVARKLRDIATELKESRKTLIILSPVLQFPPELEKDITVLDYALPTLEELDQSLERVIRSAKSQASVKLKLSEEERERVLKAAQGLTCTEAENVFAKSLVMAGKLDLDIIVAEKKQIIRKSRILEYYESKENFDYVGGMAELKEWLRKRGLAFSERARHFGLPEPKGLLLLGVQGAGKSVHGDEIIVYRQGDKLELCPIKELYERNIGEDEIYTLSLNPDTFAVEWKRISAITRHQNSKGLLRIKTKSGREVIATEDHSFLTLNEHAELVAVAGCDLVIGTFLPVVYKVSFPQETEHVFVDYLVSPYNRNPNFKPIGKIKLDWDFGFVVGAYLAEGCLTESTVAFSNVDREFQQTLLECLDKACGLIGRIRENRAKVEVHSKALIHWFQKECGNGSANKRVPGFAYFAPEEFKCGLLCGYFSGDGEASIRSDDSRVCFAYTTKSRILRDGIGLLLSHFALASFLAERRGSGKYKGNTYYRATLESCSIVPFVNEIGFVHRRKHQVAQKAKAFIQQRRRFDHMERIPLSVEGVNELGRENKLGVRGSLGRELLSNLRGKAHYGSIGQHVLRKLLDSLEVKHSTEYLGQLRKLLEAGVFWDKIVSIEPLESGEAVYDLSVEDHENFCLSNGLLVHNSLVAKAVASQWQLPLLKLDMGRVFSELVGSSEQNMRTVLSTAESVAPCILWLDELEKGLAGTASSHRSDAGTAARVFGSLLTWLQEKTSPVFTIATANDINLLPPEALRKGRFDEIFFIDLPDAEERQEIFAIHLAKRGRDPKRFDLVVLSREAEGFSGAEIEQVVISGLYDAFESGREMETQDLLRNIADTVPLSQTMKAQITALRDWACTHARPASIRK